MISTPPPLSFCGNFSSPKAQLIAVAPAAIRSAFTEAVAMIAVQIDDSGKVTKATIYQTTGDAMTDAAALADAKVVSFDPRAIGCTSKSGPFLLRQTLRGDNPNVYLPCEQDVKLLGQVNANAGPETDPNVIHVAVDVTVGPAGNAVGTKIAESSGNFALDRAAIDAASRSRWHPAVVRCHATTAHYTFKVTFR